jgi:hypothetical protein
MTERERKKERDRERERALLPGDKSYVQPRFLNGPVPII